MIRWKITQKLWHWKNTSQEARVRLEDQWGLLFRHPPCSGSDRNTLFGCRPRTHIGCRFYCCWDTCFEDGKGASALVFPCSPIGLSSWWPYPGPLWTTALQDTQVWGLSPVLRDIELLPSFLPSPVPLPSSSFGVFCVMSKAHKALLPDFVEQIKVSAPFCCLAPGSCTWTCSRSLVSIPDSLSFPDFCQRLWVSIYSPVKESGWSRNRQTDPGTERDYGNRCQHTREFSMWERWCFKPIVQSCLLNKWCGSN